MARNDKYRDLERFGFDIETIDLILCDVVDPYQFIKCKDIPSMVVDQWVCFHCGGTSHGNVCAYCTQPKKLMYN